ncbi:MAG: amino acid adenylation domain-containing protein, partial [Planctomycetes bacterium]|nr:amino acid adenylation domain-containing protein [Planctomycetota bacterium]
MVLVGRREDPATAREAVRGLPGASYRAADVADPAALAALLDAVLAEHGALRGVVHAAGVVRPGPLAARDPGEVAAVLRPKVTGALLLARELERRQLRPDVVVLCSSVSAAHPERLGGGVVDYAAANAALDALAAAERARGRPWLSIAWPAWAEVGQVAREGLLRALAARGVEALDTARALAAFDAAVASGEGHLLVAPGGDAPASAAPAPPDATPAPALAERGPGALSRDPVERRLQQLVAGALGVAPEQVSCERPFVSLGVDSVRAVALLRALEAERGAALPPTLFFEHRDLRELARALRALDAARSPAPSAPGARWPLRRAQQALARACRLHPGVPAQAWLVLELEGALHPGLLRDALGALVRRHPLLRARVEDDDLVVDEHGGEGVGEDGLALERAEGDALDVAATLANRPWGPGEPPLRARLVGARLVLAVNHVLADGASLHLLARELLAAYDALAHGRPPRLPALPSLAEAPDPPATPDDLAWWRGSLAEQAAHLRAAYPWDGPAEGPVVAWQAALAAPERRALDAWAEAAGLRPFHVLLAVWARALAAWTGAAELAVAVARARRPAGFEAVVGAFADTIPVPLVAGPGAPLLEDARGAREAWRAASARGSPSTLELGPLLRDLGAGPLPVLSFVNFDDRAPRGALRLGGTAAGTGTPLTRLTLLAWTCEGALHLSLCHPRDLLREETARALLGAVAAGLRAAAREASPDAEPAGDLDLVARVLAHARRAPAAAAVVGAAPLTYGALAARSGALAARLRAAGVGPGQVVGLLVRRGAEAAVGVLGALRAGAGWLALDPDAPGPWRAAQVAQARARVVVTGEGAPAVEGDVTTVPLPLEGDEGAPAPDGVRLAPDATAYVVFTSGSTGTPRGVPITAAALVNYLDWARTTFELGPRDRVLHTSPLVFDASVRQLLSPLLAGAAVVPADEATARDPRALLDLIAREGVTHWTSVPSFLVHALRELERHPAPRAWLGALRFVLVGGEALPGALARRAWDLLGGADGPRLVNLYGPSETTVNACFHALGGRPADDAATVPIGRAAAGALLRVVDAAGTEADRGELVIGGPGVSPGYLVADEAGRFVTDAEGRRWFRTGDLVERAADGALTFLGREDGQVKVRGHRVEVGAVEAALAAEPGVAHAVVGVVDGALVAWYEPIAAAAAG